LILGKRIDYRLGLGGPRVLNPSARVIQVDVHPQELGLNRKLDLAICADLKTTLKAALDGAGGHPSSRQQDWLRYLGARDTEWKQTLCAAGADSSTPLHPAAVYREIETAIPEDATLCWDGGDFVHWGRCMLHAKRPAHWMRLGPLATLGACLPIGLAATIARPNQPAIVIGGDGSAGFYLAEFDTAVRHNLPVVIIIGNDGCWGIERQLQLGALGDKPGDKTIACDLRRSRYDLVMKALGGEGEHVERLEQVRPALDRALASGRPYCINIEIRSARSPFSAYQLESKR